MNDIGGPRMTGTVLEKVFGDKTCHVVTLSINPNAATGLRSAIAFLGL